MSRMHQISIQMRRALWLHCCNANSISREHLTFLEFKWCCPFGPTLDNMISNATGGQSLLLPQHIMSRKRENSTLHLLLLLWGTLKTCFSGGYHQCFLLTTSGCDFSLPYFPNCYYFTCSGGLAFFWFGAFFHVESSPSGSDLLYPGLFIGLIFSVPPFGLVGRFP